MRNIYKYLFEKLSFKKGMTGSFSLKEVEKKLEKLNWDKGSILYKSAIPWFEDNYISNFNVYCSIDVNSALGLDPKSEYSIKYDPGYCDFCLKRLKDKDFVYIGNIKVKASDSLFIAQTNANTYIVLTAE